jgi:orotidine-5'-phosphate decarboxylase
MNAFLNKLIQAQRERRSCLCVRLDIVTARTPLPIQVYDEPMLPFARAIIEATRDLVCAYQFNLGYYLAEGAAGVVALERIVRLVPDEIPIILDGPFCAAGAMAEAYARGAFDQLKADAVTIFPYAGSDVVRPFLKRAERAVFVLARTISEHAWELQDLEVEPRPATDDRPRSATMPRLYEKLALLANRWHVEGPGACGLAMDALPGADLAHLRTLSPHLPFLISSEHLEGLDALMRYGRTHDGLAPIVSVSHAVIYASQREDFAAQARAAAARWVEAMRAFF